MLLKNTNLEQISEQASAELRRINHDIATQIHDLRVKHPLFAKDIAVLSGSLVNTLKLERIELEKMQNIPWETLIALGLVLNCRLKVTFEPIKDTESV